MGFIEDNERERLKFIDFWAAFVRSHDDKEWSRQQNIIINSALKSSKMTKPQYFKMKGEM
ncbi:hypothetical protein HYU14_06505 [Candidatus Woesearchaeota archaeon]|nr:hypothetical protein [Candidatus Woesearchaeota archaeon]